MHYIVRWMHPRLHSHGAEVSIGCPDRANVLTNRLVYSGFVNVSVERVHPLPHVL